MTTMLPPNSTKEERDLVESINYPIDTRKLKGFKFEPPDAFLPSLIWEYGLGEILPWLDDPRRAIGEGIQWQRLRGTPESLRIALSWAGIESVYVEEEPPGEHFAEFQIGASGDVPNGKFIEAATQLAQLSAPLRSRLTRMYNDAYDIRRFRLGHSHWGDLLSDYSGNRVTEDGTVLSFGRKNYTQAMVPQVALDSLHEHHRYVSAILLDTYRLDQAVIGESKHHEINHRSSFGRIYTSRNETGLFLSFCEHIQASHVAKAQIVLSDRWVLGDINACFPVSQITETGQPIVLDDHLLSEEPWGQIYIPLDERFKQEHVSAGVEPFDDQTTTYMHDHAVITHLMLKDYACSLTIEHRLLANETHYPGINGWHGYQHLYQSWSATSPHSEVVHTQEVQ